MILKLINESFGNKYANKETLDEASGKMTNLAKALFDANKRLKANHENNIKVYEIAFQDVIEKQFPEKSWWEVTDCDIFGSLFRGKDPELTITEILKGVKEEFKEDITPDDAFDDWYFSNSDMEFVDNRKGSIVRGDDDYGYDEYDVKSEKVEEKPLTEAKLIKRELIGDRTFDIFGKKVYVQGELSDTRDYRWEDIRIDDGSSNQIGFGRYKWLNRPWQRFTYAEALRKALIDAFGYDHADEIDDAIDSSNSAESALKKLEGVANESLKEAKTPYGDTTIEDYVKINFTGKDEDKEKLITTVKEKANGKDYFNGLGMSVKDWENLGKKFGLSMKRFPVTEKKSCSSKKKLTEGAGAGYKIEATTSAKKVERFRFNKVVSRDKYGTATIECICSILAVTYDIVAQSYMFSTYGDKSFDDIPSKITSAIIEVEVPYVAKYLNSMSVSDIGDTISDYSTYDEMSDDELLRMLNGDIEALKDEILYAFSDIKTSFIYGGGWSHSTYDGTINEDEINSVGYYTDLFGVESATIELTEQKAIEYIDKAVTGGNIYDLFIIDKNGEWGEVFEDEDEAIEFAKFNDADAVHRAQEIVFYSGEADFTDLDEIVWENDTNEGFKNRGKKEIKEAKENTETLATVDWNGSHYDIKGTFKHTSTSNTETVEIYEDRYDIVGTGKDKWYNRPWYRFKFANALERAVVNWFGTQASDKIEKAVESSRNCQEAIDKFFGLWNGVDESCKGKKCNKKIKEARGNYGHKPPFWYFTTHGTGLGTIPKDVHLLADIEGQNEKGTWGDYIALDGVLTYDELKQYDLKELAPKSVPDSVKADIAKQLGESLNEKFSKRDIEYLKSHKGEKLKKGKYSVEYNEYIDADTNEPLGGEFTLYTPAGRYGKDRTAFKDEKKLIDYINRRFEMDESLKEDDENDSATKYTTDQAKMLDELAYLLSTEYGAIEWYDEAISKIKASGLSTEDEEALIQGIEEIRHDEEHHAFHLEKLAELVKNKISVAQADKIHENKKIKEDTDKEDVIKFSYEYGIGYTTENDLQNMLDKSGDHFWFTDDIKNISNGKVRYGWTLPIHSVKKFFGFDEFTDRVAAYQAKLNNSMNEAVDKDEFYKLIIKTNGNPSIKDLVKLGYTEGTATEMVTRLSSKDRESVVNSAKKMVKNESLTEAMLFKPMTKAEAKEFYDKIKSSDLDMKMKKIVLDDLNFFTDNFEKDYGKKKVEESFKDLERDLGNNFRKIELEDDGSETGGIAFAGETLGDFLENDLDDNYELNLDELNKVLKDCGIKPLKKRTRESLQKPRHKMNESYDDIRIYMNTWANYNENGADLSAYGIESIADGWLTVDEAIDFAEEHAEDEPFINDTDGVPFEISEYDNAIEILEQLKELQESNVDEDIVAAIIEEGGYDIKEAIKIAEDGNYTFISCDGTDSDLGWEYIDQLYGADGLSEALGDRITDYIDEDAMRRDYEDDVRNMMYDDADRDDARAEIAEEQGIEEDEVSEEDIDEWVENWIDENLDSYLDSIIADEIGLAERGDIDLSTYFDYEAFGRDLRIGDGFTFVDGGAISVY